MTNYQGKQWTKQELVSYIGDPQQIAGATSCVLTDGKAEGVRAVVVRTGGGLNYTLLPGRGMDIAQASYKGRALSFISGTGITSPGYYDEPGFNWLRGFYAGLLTTCGITSCGAPSVDQGQAYGLHGRLSNAAAEDLCVGQQWQGDEYIISIKGKMREAAAMFENLSLTRSVETHLGWKRFRLHDLVENHAFEPQPLMLLYHVNFGFPLLAPGTEVVGPIIASEPWNEESAKDNGVEECLTFPEPQPGYQEKVFFHDLAADRAGRTFIALINNQITLGMVLRFSKNELPKLTQWKMPRQGFYAQGLEPGTVTPVGRGVLREQGKLPFIEGQQTCSITLEFEILDTSEEIESIKKEAAQLRG
jgi:hypothetical protein